VFINVYFVTLQIYEKVVEQKLAFTFNDDNRKHCLLMSESELTAAFSL
jgi:hypothetical protein